MECGFRVIYAYTESDEISLLFAPEETTFGKKVRKYNSILAGEASAVRTRIRVCDQLPLGDEYAEMIRKILTAEKARESK